MNTNILFILILLLFSKNLFSKDKSFSIASYNVQNLFDLHYDGSEYSDYIPFKKSKWNTRNFNIKLKNLARVINDINADILALEEIESSRALKSLMNHIDYPYFAISNTKNSPVSVALLSKYPISSKISIPITNNKNISYRDVLKVKIYIEKYPIYIYVNHWPSKRHPESQRIDYAKVLLQDISWIDEPFVLLGDFNSYYDEYKIIKRRKTLNDSNGITAINNILQTTIKKNKKYKMASKKNIFEYENILYNLWMELPKKQRYSYQYKNKNVALDHMIIPKTMLDKKGIDYIDKSFNVFRKKYLFITKKSKKSIYRWQKKIQDGHSWSKKRPDMLHLGKGYSDHLPISARFKIVD